MFRPSEQPAAANAHCLEQSVAVKKTAVEHRNHRLRFRHKPAVEKNNHGLREMLLIRADYLHRAKAKQAIPGQSWVVRQA